MGAIKNLWNDITLICDKHNEPLAPTMVKNSLLYVCPKKNEKEMCKLAVTTKTYESLLYKISDAVRQKEKDGVLGPLPDTTIKQKPYVFVVHEEDGKYVVRVSDMRNG